jgi:hypothetical protein
MSTLRPLRRPLEGVAGVVGDSQVDLPELGIDDSTRALARCHSCNGGRLGLLWRRRNGVTLADVRCPVCNGTVAQTTHALRSNFYVLTDTYVRVCVDTLKAERKARQAERIAAGAAKLARNLEPGDVIHTGAGTGPVRVIGPSSKKSRIGTRLAIDVAVAAENVRRHQPWSVITIEPRKTDEVALYGADELEGVEWADLNPGAAMLAMARDELDTHTRLAARSRADAGTYGARVAGEVNANAARHEAEAAEAQAIVELLESAKVSA